MDPTSRGRRLPAVRARMEGELVARADLFVDSREAALAEAGDIVLPINRA